MGREERAQTMTTRTADNHGSAAEHTYCTRAETVAETATRESGCSAKQETQIQPLTANPWCIFHCPVRREESSDYRIVFCRGIVQCGYWNARSTLFLPTFLS